MKLLNFLLSFIVLSQPIYFYSCAEKLSPSADSSNIAVLKGLIDKNIPETYQVKSFSLLTSSPVADYKTYTVDINDDGTFRAEIPMFFSNLAVIQSPVYHGVVYLIPGQETLLNINNEEGQPKVTYEDGTRFTADDMLNILSFNSNIIFQQQEFLPNFSVLSAEEYKRQTISFVDESLDLALNEPSLSEYARQYVAEDLKMFFVSSSFFPFTNMFGDSLGIDRSYFGSVFDHFNLNDSALLNSTVTYMFQQELLENRLANIPAIDERPVEKWITQTADILQYSSKNKLFYDLLAANSYIKQLGEGILLTEKQLDNIEKYYSKNKLYHALMAENNSLKETQDHNRTSPTVIINETPATSKELVLDSIIDRYKGKVVIVDFWATWCGPCLEAIKHFDPIKKEMKDQDVVFVYITDPSSPVGLWEQKISQIEGEHYYLTEEEKEYIMDDKEFSTIPTYLIYDKKGRFVEKLGSISSIPRIKEKVDELLKD